MLNLFGAIATGLGKMLPGYLNGYRMAIQDNWNDLKNYNAVQQGQINNAWLESSFLPMYNQLWADTYMKQAAANGMGLQEMLNSFAAPGRVATTLQNTYAAPDINAMRINDTGETYAQKDWTRGVEREMYPGMMDIIRNNMLNMWGRGTGQDTSTLPSSTTGGYVFGDPEAIARGR